MHPIHCPRLSDPGHTSLVMKDRKNQGGTAGRNLWEMDIFPARDFSSFPSESIKRILPNPTVYSVYRHFFTMDFDCALLADFGKQAFLLANRSTCTANRCTKNHVATTPIFSHFISETCKTKNSVQIGEATTSEFVDFAEEWKILPNINAIKAPFG